MSDLIVIDIETTGLDPQRHVVIEVAAVNVRTGEEFAFVPYLDGDDLREANRAALRINRYFERGVAEAALPSAETRVRYEQLWKMLAGNTIGGANIRFDAEMLRWSYSRAFLGPQRVGTPLKPTDEPWNYRLADLGSYVAGALGIQPALIPSLAAVTLELGVTNTDPHTALGDARAAAGCFRKLADMSGRKLVDA